MDQNEIDLELKAKLETEAKEYCEMSKLKRSTYSNKENENYIINRKWLSKWKKYVDYNHAKENSRSHYYSYSYNKKEYSIDVDSFPGEIDNNSLLVPMNEFLNDGDSDNYLNQVIRHDIDQKKEIKIITRKMWEFFQSRYGGGPQIVKYLIEDKSRNYSSTRIVEIFYRKIRIFTIPERKNATNEILEKIEPEVIYISRTKSINDLKSHIIQLKKKKNFYDENHQVQNLRLWKFNDNSESSWKEALEQFAKISNELMTTKEKVKYDKITCLEDVENAQLDDIDFADTDICLVECADNSESWIFEYEKKSYKNGKCEWCSNYKLLRFLCGCNEVGYCSQRCQMSDRDYHKKRCRKAIEDEEREMSVYSSDSIKGLCGLQNLGNTCFMNSSLQCISNCYELTEYFLKDHFQKDINKDNPLGSGGDLCRAYANFLKNLWYGRNQVFSPWAFKRSISGFQSMFSGYQQHDTQEFLNYLLDGLHEDLNRVLKKPLVEKDETNRPDEEKSRDSWIGFLRRNQSVLVDIFYGLFKSTLYCPDCENISTCFDPFLSVSLPLAAKTETYEVVCNFVFFDMKLAPIQLNLQFSSETTLLALRNKIAKILKIHPFSFLIVKYDPTNIINGPNSQIHSSIDYFLNSHNLLKPTPNNFYSQTEKKVYNMIQFDPSLFYSGLNNTYFKNTKPEDIRKQYLNEDYENIGESLLQKKQELAYLFCSTYDEDESGETSETTSYYSKQLRESSIYTIHSDENHGFIEDFIPVIINFSKYDTNYSNITHIYRRTKILSPRVIYLCKKWKLSYLHQYIFTYITKLYGVTETEKIQQSYEDVFSNLDTDIEHDSIEFQKKMKYPYRLRMKKTSSDNRMTSGKGDCTYCSNSNCWDCLLPYSEEKSLADLLELIPKSPYTKKEIDNTYYYLADRYRNYINLNNVDFGLELSFLEETSKFVSDLPEKVSIDFKANKNNNDRTMNLIDCFKNFVKLEKLESNNEWFCPECKNHVKATKKMEIYNAPKILIIHLKRFKNNSKIDTVVDFPLDNLDISEFVLNKEKDEKLEYELFAVANHFGSMGFGHYTAYAKNKFTKLWYDFDDSSVSRKSPDDIVGKSAYVLFYRRKNMENKVDFDELYEKKFHNWENYLKKEINISNCPEKEAKIINEVTEMDVDDSFKNLTDKMDVDENSVKEEKKNN